MIVGLKEIAVIAGLTSLRISSILLSIGVFCVSASILPIFFGWLRTICQVDEDFPLFSRHSTRLLMCGIALLLTGATLVLFHGEIADYVTRDRSDVSVEQVENINIDENVDIDNSDTPIPTRSEDRDTFTEKDTRRYK